MAQIKIRHFVKSTNMDGSHRFYWRPSASLRAAGWKTIRLSDDKHTAIAQAEGINRDVDQWRDGQKKDPHRALPGTLHALIEEYKKSREWKKLRPKTQKDYKYALKIIREWGGDTPSAAVSALSVQTLYDVLREKTPRKAAFVIQVLRLLFNFAERRSIITKGSNPASKPRLEYKAAKGKIWTPDAVRHMVRTADDMGQFSIGTAIMLNEWIGQRRGDILALDMDAYQDGEIKLTQSKTGAEIEGLVIDEIPELKARIEEQIKQNRARKNPGQALIQQQDGKRYKGDWFNHAFNKIRTEAAKTMPAVADLIFKDLRHTAVTRLADSGAEVTEIAAVTGHSFKTCQELVDRYNVRTRKQARNAFIKRKQAGVK